MSRVGENGLINPGTYAFTVDGSVITWKILVMKSKALYVRYDYNHVKQIHTSRNFQRIGLTWSTQGVVLYEREGKCANPPAWFSVRLHGSLDFLVPND